MQPISRRAALGAPIAAVLRGGQKSIEQVDLFRQGESGVHTYRIPALLETHGGALLAIADARHDGSGDLPGRLSLVMRRSRDGGRTWSPMRTILAPAEGGAGDASLLLDRRSHRVWCFHAYGPPGIGFRTAKAGAVTGPQTLQFHAMYSDDDGESWSSPVDLTPQVKDPDWQALFATSGTHFETRGGRFVVPLVVRDGAGQVAARNAYSDDRGKTWKVGPAIGPGTDESKAVELPDGSVMQNMRAPAEKGSRAVALSRDGGVTFESVRQDAALPDPGCNAGIAMLPGGVLAFTNAASPSKRENLTVRLSSDEGKTWPHSRVVHAGPAGYSTVVPLRGRGIGVLYERGDRHAAERITFARFSADWVKQAGG